MFETLFPIFFLVLLATILAVAMAFISVIFGRRSWEGAKGEPYESGMKPKGDTRGRVPVKFFMIAILFILFDLEVVFLYPWAVIYQSLGLFGFIEMLVFIVILLVGYFYILGKGALKWE